MSDMDIPIALALILGGLAAYAVWVHVHAAERMSERRVEHQRARLCALQRQVGAHSPECVSCRRRTRGAS